MEGHDVISYLEGYQEGKMAGIKEVVEWVNERNKKGYLSHCGFHMLWDKKLKDWGIKEEV